MVLKLEKKCTLQIREDLIGRDINIIISEEYHWKILFNYWEIRGIWGNTMNTKQRQLSAMSNLFIMHCLYNIERLEHHKTNFMP